ncbi:MAG: Csp1 family four helix bundle copper storage protein, partial [Myxococcota bacterium]
SGVAAAGAHRAGQKHYMPSHDEFRAQAERCLGDGHACLDHCLALLGKGETSIAECAKIVKQMNAVCAAIGPVASTGSRHVKALAKLCLEVCTDCKEECDKHAKKHEQCKVCSESCAKMIEIARKLA